jgi:hypothetical protein
MPEPSSAVQSAISSAGDLSGLLDKVASGQVDPGQLERLLGSKGGSLDPSAITSMLGGGGSSGPSFLDPTYIVVAGSLQAIATGLLIYAKKAGDLRALFWGLALFVISYDYTSWVCWAIAVPLGALGFFLE